MTKFKVGELVLLANKTEEQVTFNLTKVVDVKRIQVLEKTYLKQDGLYGKPTGPEVVVEKDLYMVFIPIGGAFDENAIISVYETSLVSLENQEMIKDLVNFNRQN